MFLKMIRRDETSNIQVFCWHLRGKAHLSSHASCVVHCLHPEVVNVIGGLLQLTYLPIHRFYLNLKSSPTLLDAFDIDFLAIICQV